MSALVITLPRRTVHRRAYPVPSARRQMLAKLRCDSDLARGGHRISNDLIELSRLAKYAHARQRSINWRGIRFPLAIGLAINSVLDPETGRPLVGGLSL